MLDQQFYSIFTQIDSILLKLNLAQFYYINIFLPIFLSITWANACRNSLVFAGSCPLTIFDGLAFKFSPRAKEMQSIAFSRYLILPSLSEKILKNTLYFKTMETFFQIHG